MIKHTFTAVNDTAIVGADEWNEPHAIDDAVAGGLLVGAPADADGYSWLAPGGLGSLLVVGAGPSPAWLAPGAAGAILASTGPAAAPIWTRTPSLDSLTTIGALNVGNNAAAIPVDTLLVVGNTDAPTNVPAEIRSRTATALGFKNAANTQLYGSIGGGPDANIGLTDAFHISANAPSQALVLNRNGGNVLLRGTTFFGWGTDANATSPGFRLDGPLTTIRAMTANGAAWVPMEIAGLRANGVVNVGPNGATIPAGTLLVVGTVDTPAQNVMELRGTGANFAFKNAANTKSYGYIIGGGNDALGVGSASVSVLRVGGNGPLVLNENGSLTVIGPGGFAMGGVSNTFPSLRRDAAEPITFRLRVADDTAFANARGKDFYVNNTGGGGGAAGEMLVGGIDAGRQFGGIWVGTAAPTFSNYAFLATNTGTSATTLFGTPYTNSDIEFRVANAAHFSVGNTGAHVNEPGGTIPTQAFRVRSANGSTILFTIPDNGQANFPLLGAFAAGDKYVTIDAAGNLHKSAIGPAS